MTKSIDQSLLAIAEELLAEQIHERDCFFNCCTLRDDLSTADPEDRETLRQMDNLIDRARAVIAKTKGETK